MSTDRSIQEGACLQKKNCLVTENSNVLIIINWMPTKIQIIVTTIMMQEHPMKEFVPEQCTPKSQSYRLWWGADDQSTISHGTYIHIITYRILNLFQLLRMHIHGMYMYIIMNWVYRLEPSSLGGNTLFNSRASALIPQPASNGMEGVCWGHGSN